MATNTHTAGLDLQAMMDMPYGAAGRMIRETVDPLWGKGKPDAEGECRFVVTLTVDHTQTVEYSVTVEASSAAEAEEIARGMLDDDELDEGLEIDTETEVVNATVEEA
ncbi:hypothetical protein [Telmatospirillum sp. J64-1]|uniref:hypothetical protein n=1 Tax=Telmatospirillum sp. J64-1 TaxID=2502183 RepID=UPI00115F058D|nr:hypothetical protein [Telmatospirillum sp. J64-1]